MEAGVSDRSQLLWIYSTNELERARLEVKEDGGLRRIALSKKAVYSEFARRELHASGVCPDGRLAADSPVREWHAALQHTHGCIVGFVLMRPAWSPSVLTLLGDGELALRDLWFGRGFCNSPLVFADLLGCLLQCAGPCAGPCAAQLCGLFLARNSVHSRADDAARMFASWRAHLRAGHPSLGCQVACRALA